MASFGSNYAASPVLTMPPQPAHRASFGSLILPHQSSSSGATAPWSHSHLRSSCLAAGRKRSRDEAAVNLDPPEKMVEPPILHEAEDEWEYGPGMILIKKNSRYVADASSQSGTWVEEKAAEEEARKAAAAVAAQEQASQSRPSLRSNKSQRLEMSSHKIMTATSVDGHGNDRSSPSRDMASTLSTSADGPTQPIVDDFTLHLGIGWSRISDDEHIQAAARGWARYIENHYPINDVKIRLESRGLQSYLVEANEGYFLFAENLRQGRLVSKDSGQALQNLKTSPPTFEALNIMEPTETPKPVDSALEPISESEAATFDMDMS